MFQTHGILRKMGQYSIRELEKFSGVKAHTIRIWEQRYNLLDPKRTETNIRYYNDEQLKYLLNVVLLLKNGFRISQVSTFEPDRIAQELVEIFNKRNTRENDWTTAGINAFIKAMIDFDEDAFHLVYQTSINDHGIDDTLTGIVYPFLERIGVMWAIGEINPAHEHFMCNLIRQKLVAAIDELPMARVGPPVLLCLPEGEYHETGLLVALYLLKKHDRKVLYLGQNIPTACIKTVVETKKPERVLTFLTNPRLKHCSGEIAKELKQACGDTELAIGLPAGHSIEISQKDGVKFLHTMEELRQFV